VSAEARLADNVVVGPHAVIEGKVAVGRGCILHPGAMVFGPVTLGRGNIICAGAVLGEKPQHLNYKNEPTGLRIGAFNTFHKNVTVHRAAVHSASTRIGSHNTFMANSHVAHDCAIGNHCTLGEGALLAGHCLLDDHVYLAENSAVHQFTRIGRLAILCACSITTKDIPPFIVQQYINAVVRVNVEGMCRTGMKREQIAAVLQAFRIVFEEGLPLPAALDRLENTGEAIDAVREMMIFLRQCKKGINYLRVRSGGGNRLRN
jgi:UDP-N-acetylglucosamine acyltransferase